MPGWRPSRPFSRRNRRAVLAVGLVVALVSAAALPLRALRLQPAASQEREGGIDGDAGRSGDRSRLDAQHHQRPRPLARGRRTDRAPARCPAGSVAHRHAAELRARGPAGEARPHPGRRPAPRPCARRAGRAGAADRRGGAAGACGDGVGLAPGGDGRRARVAGGAAAGGRARSPAAGHARRPGRRRHRRSSCRSTSCSSGSAPRCRPVR